MKYLDLFYPNGVFIETPNYILRQIQSADASYYKKLAASDFSSYLTSIKTEVLSSSSDHAWESLQDHTHLTCTILSKKTMTFCGFCQLQWIFESTPELGIDLLPEFQKQGVATEVLPAFLSQAKKLLPIDYFYSKIKKNNLSSQRLAEKIGGVFVGTKSLLPKNFPAEMKPLAEKEFPDFFYLEYHFYTKTDS